MPAQSVHDELSPLHTSQSSNTASPPHTPLQSKFDKQLPSQSKPSTAYVHVPSSVFASGS